MVGVCKIKDASQIIAFFLFLMDASAAYGSSQDKGQIGAAAASLATAMATLDPSCI